MFGELSIERTSSFMAKIENDLSERRETREFPTIDQSLTDELYITLQFRRELDEQIYYDQAEVQANKIRDKILALHGLTPSQIKEESASVVDSKGQLMLSQSDHLSHIEMKDLAAGVYIVVLIFKDRISQHRIVKIK